MAISLIIYAILKLYLIVNIYQQAHYQFKLYFKHFIINLPFYDIFPLIVLIIGNYQNFLLIDIVCSIYLTIFGLFYLFTRIKLKWTKRVFRIYILSLCCLFLLWIPYVGSYIVLFLEFSIIPILCLERGMSYLSNRPYLIKATCKMQDYKGIVIAITGSFGKTSTKNLFFQALNLFYSVAATEKSYNTELGISKFINSIPDLNVYDYLILEFGASHKGDIAKLKKIAQPQIVVITGIGLMHVDTFGCLDDIIKEKMSIVDGAQLAILNADCEYIRAYPVPHNVEAIRYGIHYGDYRATIYNEHEFSFQYRDHLLSKFKHQLTGEHQTLNLLAPLAYLDRLECDWNRLVRGVYTFHGVPNRLELKMLHHRYVIDDSFNSNYKGFIEALNILKVHCGKRILLTPGMVELGKYKKELFSNLVSHIISSADIIILIGYYQTKFLYQILKQYSNEVYVVHNFMEGYGLYLQIVENEKNSILLIENDVPDLYRVGLI